MTLSSLKSLLPETGRTHISRKRPRLIWSLLLHPERNLCFLAFIKAAKAALQAPGRPDSLLRKKEHIPTFSAIRRMERRRQRQLRVLSRLQKEKEREYSILQTTALLYMITVSLSEASASISAGSHEPMTILNSSRLSTNSTRDSAMTLCCLILQQTEETSQECGCAPGTSLSTGRTGSTTTDTPLQPSI